MSASARAMRDCILHLADLHLGETHNYLGTRAAERRREADGVLSRIVERVQSPDSRVGGVIIAGDLFETHAPEAPLVERVIDDLRKVVQAGVPVLTVPGNHDELSYPDGVYRQYGARWPGTLVTAPNPTKVDRWEVGGTTVDLYAMAYVAGRSRAPFDRFTVETGAAKRIAVLHGSVDLPTSDRSLPLSSAALKECGLHYVALGHIHKPRDWRVGLAWACYPGRIEGAGFDDPGGAGLVEVEVTGQDCKPRRVEFASRRIESVRVNLSSFARKADLDAHLARIVDEDSARCLRLVLHGLAAFAVEPAELAEELRPRVWHLEIQTREASLKPWDLQELEQERTVRGLFVKKLRARLDAAKTDSERRQTEAALRHGLAAFGAAASSAGETR